MFTRKIGKFLRGKATPFQVFTASCLGACVGFLPAFAQAPGLYVALLCVLLIVNANIGVAALVALPARLLSMLFTGGSFAVGRFFLDGPTSGLFAKLVNAPVLAWFGLEYYVTTGGLFLGLVFGAVVGWGLVSLLQGTRRKLAGLEAGSERYREFTSKKWVKATSFVFIGGGKRKKSFDELAAKRVGNPVRIVGVVASVSVLALVFALHGLLASPFLANALRGGLERANGATVDLAGFDLDLGDARLRIDHLALANRNALDTDIFRGLTFEADLSTEDFLKKRLKVDRLVVREAKSGEKRAQPGERIGPDPEPLEEPVTPGEELSLEDVLADAERWRERLSTTRRWLERLLPEASENSGGEGAAPAEESLRERLERQAREQGYGQLVAAHLIEEAPRLLISELVIEGLTLASVEGEVFDLHANNLSTDPHLLSEDLALSLRSRSGRIQIQLGLDAGRANSPTFAFEMRDMSVDALAGNLRVNGERPIEGGTLDLVLTGSFDRGRAGWIDAPLVANLHDSTLRVPGFEPTTVENFELPIALRGPLDGPAIRVDDDELVSALVAAGKDELARRVRAELDQRVDELKGELNDRLGDEMTELEGRLADELGERLDGVDPAAGADGGSRERARRSVERRRRTLGRQGCAGRCLGDERRGFRSGLGGWSGRAGGEPAARFVAAAVGGWGGRGDLSTTGASEGSTKRETGS